MNIKSLRRTTVAALILISAIKDAAAGIVTIEPDDYADGTVLNSMGPGTRLVNFGFTAGDATPTLTDVLAVPWSWSAVSPAPTGVKVFGHAAPGPADHWSGVALAQDCMRGLGCIRPFYVFSAVFPSLTKIVEVRTTMAPWALDGAELWAFDYTWKPLAVCRVRGVTVDVRRTGVMPNPTYGSRILPPPATPVECGKVLSKSMCEPGGEPGSCSYIVTASIKRVKREIAALMWGALLPGDSTAPVDRLRYDY